MTSVDDVRTVCKRLASHGWADLLGQHGLDITAPNLAEELAKELPGIRRHFLGFDDFPIEGKCGSRARPSGSQPAVPRSHLYTRLPDSLWWLQVS